MPTATVDLSAIAIQAVHAHGAIQKPPELAAFLALAVGVDPKVIVEIGSYAGGTLAAWSAIAPTVIGIDLPPTGIYAATGTEQQHHGARMVFGDSHDSFTLQELLLLLAGRKVDVLFIDGDHSYEGVKRDFEMYSPAVRPGGLIGFHDIVQHPEQPDIEVWRYWQDIRTDAALELIIGDARWGGIGVLHASGA